MGRIAKYTLLCTLVYAMILGRISCDSIDSPPENSASLIGTQSRLNCTVTTSLNDIAWLHHLEGSDPGGDTIYTINDGVLDPEFDVDVHGQGSYDLIVKDVKQALAGIYTCKLLVNDISAHADLVALRELTCTPPEGDEELEEGQLAGLTCQTEFYGYNKPKLEWFSSVYGRIENQYTEEVRDPDNPDEVEYIARQVANFSVVPEYNEMGFQCRLTFEKEEDTEPEPPKYTDSCNTYFYVLHYPQNIEIYPPPESFPDNVIEVRIGDEINCSASARPDPMYEWKDIADTEFYVGQVLTINADMYPPEGDAPERTYRCIVTNEINGQPQSPEREFKFRIASGSSNDDSDNTGLIIVISFLIVVSALIGVVVFVLYWYRRLQPRLPKSPSGSTNLKQVPPSTVQVKDDTIYQEIEPYVIYQDTDNPSHVTFEGEVTPEAPYEKPHPYANVDNLPARSEYEVIKVA